MDNQIHTESVPKFRSTIGTRGRGKSGYYPIVKSRQLQDFGRPFVRVPMPVPASSIKPVIQLRSQLLNSSPKSDNNSAVKKTNTTATRFLGGGRLSNTILPLNKVPYCRSDSEEYFSDSSSVPSSDSEAPKSSFKTQQPNVSNSKWDTSFLIEDTEPLIADVKSLAVEEEVKSPSAVDSEYLPVDSSELEAIDEDLEPQGCVEFDSDSTSYLDPATNQEIDIDDDIYGMDGAAIINASDLGEEEEEEDNDEEMPYQEDILKKPDVKDEKKSDDENEEGGNCLKKT